MKRKNSVVYTVIVTALMTLSSAYGQQTGTGRQGPLPFESYDLNGNELIEKSEFINAWKVQNTQKPNRKSQSKMKDPSTLFTLFDVNGDELLTEQELNNGRMGMQAKNAASFNKGMNKGRKKGQKSMPTFSDIDINGDARIDENELNQFRAVRLSNKASEGRKMKNAANIKSFEEIDLNSDGSIDVEEFTLHQRNHMNR